MRQNRHSTKIYIVHRNTISDSFRMRIVWFQPKQDSDRIRISFFKNKIGSDSENPLSDHLWFTQGSFPTEILTEILFFFGFRTHGWVRSRANWSESERAKREIFVQKRICRLTMPDETARYW